VGNTEPAGRTRPCSTVHPHVRGEYAVSELDEHVRHGSPPRAWGIRRQRGDGGRDHRFTPTCVGNTFQLPLAHRSPPVHPHVRGEYSGWANIPVWSSGSPPRAWGILRQASLPAPALRFTPTCVGNTEFFVCEIVIGAVHPHVRGEYQASADSSRANVGSPPRAWGIQVGR